MNLNFSSSGQYKVQIDGSARYNPGPAGIGVAIFTPDGRLIKEISRFIGIKTNNQAEYEALIVALIELKKMNFQAAIIQTDSELLYNQIIGNYSVKNEKLKPLYNRAKRLLKTMPFTQLVLVPREQNRLTDKLAKKASAGVLHPRPDEKNS